MQKEVSKKIMLLKANYTIDHARTIIEKKTLFKPAQQFVQSMNLYLPFWHFEVVMKLRPAFKKGQVIQKVPMMVNALTGRALVVKGSLDYSEKETKGVFLKVAVDHARAQEKAQTEALCATRKIVNPPENEVTPGKLVYYPLSLVRTLKNGQEEVMVFDHLLGSFDKGFLRYLRIKEELERKQNLAIR